MGSEQTTDHTQMSRDEYRARDRDCVKAEQARQAAQEELDYWAEHRIKGKDSGLLFDI